MGKGRRAYEEEMVRLVNPGCFVVAHFCGEVRVHGLTTGFVVQPSGMVLELELELRWVDAGCHMRVIP